MLMFEIPFGTTDWAAVERTEHAGETGKAYWRTRTFNNIRVRMVEYTPGYLADHWCQKGHILLVLEGELHTELADGRRFVLKPGTVTEAVTVVGVAPVLDVSGAKIGANVSEREVQGLPVNGRQMSQLMQIGRAHV